MLRYGERKLKVTKLQNLQDLITLDCGLQWEHSVLTDEPQQDKGKRSILEN